MLFLRSWLVQRCQVMKIAMKSVAANLSICLVIVDLKVTPAFSHVSRNAGLQSLKNSMAMATAKPFIKRFSLVRRRLSTPSSFTP